MAAIFGIEQRPPIAHTILLGIQYLLKFFELLALPLLLAAMTGMSIDAATDLLAFSLFAAAIATLLQTLPLIGSGYLLPASPGIAFFASGLLAVRIGGTALYSGMTIIGGAFQALITPLIRRWRCILTPTVAGFMLILLGLWLGELGVREILIQQSPTYLLLHDVPISAGTPAAPFAETSMAIAVLFLMSAMRVLGGKRLRLYSLGIGLLIGWIGSYVFGFVDASKLETLANVPWLRLPRYTAPNFAWNPMLIGSFLLAGVVSALQLFALVSSQQRANLSPPKGIALNRIRHASLMNSVGLMISGGLGAIPQEPLPGAIAVQHASGAFSRQIGYVYVVLLALVAFCPKLHILFLSLPVALNGAALVFLGAHLLMAAGDLIPWKSLDNHHYNALSLTLSLTVAVMCLPSLQSLILRPDLGMPFPLFFIGTAGLLIMGSLFAVCRKVERWLW